MHSAAVRREPPDNITHIIKQKGYTMGRQHRGHAYPKFGRIHGRWPAAPAAPPVRRPRAASRCQGGGAPAGPKFRIYNSQLWIPDSPSRFHCLAPLLPRQGHTGRHRSRPTEPLLPAGVWRSAPQEHHSSFKCRQCRATGGRAYINPEARKVSSQTVLNRPANERHNQSAAQSEFQLLTLGGPHEAGKFPVVRLSVVNCNHHSANI